jgi:hypothetical protein
MTLESPKNGIFVGIGYKNLAPMKYSMIQHVLYTIGFRITCRIQKATKAACQRLRLTLNRPWKVRKMGFSWVSVMNTSDLLHEVMYAVNKDIAQHWQLLTLQISNKFR